MQSASLPGSELLSRGDFLLAASLARLAASLALEASSDFETIVLAIWGFSSKKSESLL